MAVRAVRTCAAVGGFARRVSRRARSPREADAERAAYARARSTRRTPLGEAGAAETPRRDLAVRESSIVRERSRRGGGVHIPACA